MSDSIEEDDRLRAARESDGYDDGDDIRFVEEYDGFVERFGLAVFVGAACVAVGYYLWPGF